MGCRLRRCKPDRIVHPVIWDDLERITRADLPWQTFSGTTVLVTGGAGLLPAYLIETLIFLNRHRLQRSARIIALVRNAERARRRFQPYLANRELELVEQNVCEPLAHTGRLDYIVHAASPASPTSYLADPVGTLSANVLGTHHLLDAAQRLGVRTLLFFSSGAVYGNVAGKTDPIAEHDMGPLDPAGERACYEEAKRMGETMCVAWTRQFGLSTRIVRPWHTYGPGMRLDDGRVFADFVRDILNGGPIVLQSDGRARRCFCYLADATLAFFTVLLVGADGEAYNVANPDGESSIGELADRLATLYRHEGMTVRRALAESGADGPAQTPILPNMHKLQQLGWHAHWSLEAGFERTVRSYRPRPNEVAI